jgi:hypothetical protein
MQRIYIIFCFLAIFLSFAPSNSLAESIFGDEGVYDPFRQAKPDKDGKIYVQGTRMYEFYMLREKDRFIRAEWARRLPEVEAEYRRIYGPPLEERNKK